MALTLHSAPWVVTNDPGTHDGEPVADGAVLVDGRDVLEVGPRGELASRHPAARERSWPGVLTPGLVNAHAHLQYSDYGDLAGSGLPFDRWIAALQRGAAPSPPSSGPRELGAACT